MYLNFIIRNIILKIIFIELKKSINFESNVWQIILRVTKWKGWKRKIKNRLNIKRVKIK